MHSGKEILLGKPDSIKFYISIDVRLDSQKKVLVFQTQHFLYHDYKIENCSFFKSVINICPGE